jgi:AcrR family transcriptional regulator
MAGRPRSATDDEILAATARAVSKAGPDRLTLADVAAEAGLAPATLVQRFGSKRKLLLAFAAQASQGVAEAFASARAAHDSPLEALLEDPLGATRAIATPAELARHLAFLQLELADPEFYEHTLVHARATRTGIRRLLDAAVEAGELIPCDTARLSESVYVTYNGALLAWAILRRGRLNTWLRRQLAFVLEPFLFNPPRSQRKSDSEVPHG